MNLSEEKVGAFLSDLEKRRVVVEAADARQEREVNALKARLLELEGARCRPDSPYPPFARRTASIIPITDGVL